MVQVSGIGFVYDDNVYLEEDANGSRNLNVWIDGMLWPDDAHNYRQGLIKA